MSAEPASHELDDETLHREIAEMSLDLESMHICQRGGPGPLGRRDYEFIHAALKHIQSSRATRTEQPE